MSKTAKIPESNILHIETDHPVLPGFIVLEGIDGAGKTFQSRQVATTLQQEIFLTSEPTRGPIGQVIRTLLGHNETMLWDTLALLFAADRTEHLYQKEYGILTRCTQKMMVICDRYLFSSLAYQGSFVDIHWVWELNRRFPLPEYLFFLDICPDSSQIRRDGRSRIQYSEDIRTLEKVYQQYQRILAMFAHTAMHIHRIDATLDSEEITLQISNILRSADR